MTGGWGWRARTVCGCRFGVVFPVGESGRAVEAQVVAATTVCSVSERTAYRLADQVRHTERGAE